MTNPRITILTLLVCVAATIGLIAFLFHLPAHRVQNAQRLHLEIPDALWEPASFDAIETRTKKVGLPGLRTIVLPDHDLEVRLWSDSLNGIKGLILRRSSGKWSAIYLYQVYDWEPSSVKVEILRSPKSGWEDVWKRLVSAGILTLPDGYSKEECKSGVLDGIGYIVETNFNREYRTFAYGNPQYAKCDEARQIVLIEKIIAEEFDLYRILATRTAEEEKYWEMLDKTNPDELKAYLAKYPVGLYVYLAKVYIRDIEAASNRYSSVGSSSAKVAAPDPAVDRRMTGEFVHIPAGKFMMGSTNGDTNEQPVHKAVISRSFDMGKYEVTQEQWELVMGSNPSYFREDKHLPVDNVSFGDVQQFIGLLNFRSRKYIYRLPTEAEWEYACRAGSRGEYAGNFDAMAWYGMNSGGKTHPVGQKQPNAWGLYDMYGNLWEMCSDWYGNYSNATVPDLKGTSSESSHVIRGGCWSIPAKTCRSATRNYYTNDHGNYQGFRLARTLK